MHLKLHALGEHTTAQQQARVAIYVAPDWNSELWAFGCELLGYDAATGREHRLPKDLPCDEVTWREWTKAPRHYGFHATLKAPFELRPGVGLDAILEAGATWARDRSPVVIPRLVVRSIGAFVALLPELDSPELNALASSCVEAFEPLRQPLTAQHRERRLQSSLSPRQIELLDRYGYPYVLDEFRFHMTLTGALPAERVELVRKWLADRYAHVKPGLTIDVIAVFAQRSPSDRFEIVARLPLLS